MPVIKSAKKKLRKDKKLKKHNDLIRDALKSALKDAKKSPTPEKIRKATVLTDKAAKKNLIHKNKAGHLKSGLSKLMKNKPSKVKANSPKTKTSKAKK